MVRGLWLVAMISVAAGAAPPKTKEAFEKQCTTKGGEVIPAHDIFTLGRIPIPVSCGYQPAADGNRLCSSADPADRAPNDCASCQHEASCGPAAGDFGPHQCHCSKYSRVEIFGRAPPVTAKLISVGGPAGFDVAPLEAFLAVRATGLAGCVERTLVANSEFKGGKVSFEVRLENKARPGGFKLKLDEIKAPTAAVDCYRSATSGFQSTAPTPVVITFEFAPKG